VIVHRSKLLRSKVEILRTAVVDTNVADVTQYSLQEVGVIGKTVDNLNHAAEGEEHEWQHMYPDFAKVARAEGFEEVAKVMESIAVAEKFHGERYRALAANIQKGLVFKRDNPKTLWRCRNCGYIHEGPEALDACPACAHPKAHFEIAALNW